MNLNSTTSDLLVSMNLPKHTSLATNQAPEGSLLPPDSLLPSVLPPIAKVAILTPVLVDPRCPLHPKVPPEQAIKMEFCARV